MSERGQSLVEISISLVLLLLLFVGMAEFGISFFQFVQIRDAAQEGGLYGSYCQDESQILSRIIGSSNSPIDLTDENVFILIEYVDDYTKEVIAKSDIEEGDGIRIRVSYRHKVFSPFLPGIIGEYLMLNGEVTDTILRVEC